QEAAGGKLARALRGIGALLRDDLARLSHKRRLRGRLGGIKDPRARAEVAGLISGLALLKRREVLLPLLEPIFQWWQVVHVPAAIVFGLAAAAHIFIEELGPWLGR